MAIRLAIPNRGRLHEYALSLLTNRLLCMDDYSNRRLIKSVSVPQIGDIEIIQLRSTDIPRMVEQGVVDCGITGNDYYLESSADIIEVANLHMLNGALCILTGYNSRLKSMHDLVGKAPIVCYSQYPRLAEYVCKKISDHIICKPIDGAAESYILLNECDIIIDIVSTGQTYIENNLRVILQLTSVSSYLYMGKCIDTKKKKNIESFVSHILGIEFSNVDYVNDSFAVLSDNLALLVNDSKMLNNETAN